VWQFGENLSAFNKATELLIMSSRNLTEAKRKRGKEKE